MFQIIALYATVVELIVISEEDAATPKVKNEILHSELQTVRNGIL